MNSLINEHTFHSNINGKAISPIAINSAVRTGVNAIPINKTGMRKIKGNLLDSSSNAPNTPSVGYILIENP